MVRTMYLARARGRLSPAAPPPPAVFTMPVGMYAGSDTVSYFEHMAMARYIHPGGTFVEPTQGDLMWAPFVQDAGRASFEAK